MLNEVLEIEIRTFIRTESVEVFNELASLKKRHKLNDWLSNLVNAYFNGTLGRMEGDESNLSQQDIANLINSFTTMANRVNELDRKLQEVTAELAAYKRREQVEGAGTIENPALLQAIPTKQQAQRTSVLRPVTMEPARNEVSAAADKRGGMSVKEFFGAVED